jgi:hypothetical protein
VFVAVAVGGAIGSGASGVDSLPPCGATNEIGPPPLAGREALVLAEALRACEGVEVTGGCAEATR